MGPLRMHPPPAHTVVLVHELTSDRDLKRIRDGLIRFFAENPGADQPEDADIADFMGLVATELAGNALRHGRPPVIFRLLRADNCYVVDVSDAAPREIPEPADVQGDIRTGGRGLRIALSMSEQVGWHATENAKHVWAAFPRRRGNTG
jgi:serine/threonine-protein kinase RsbW